MAPDSKSLRVLSTVPIIRHAAHSYTFKRLSDILCIARYACFTTKQSCNPFYRTDHIRQHLFERNQYVARLHQQILRLFLLLLIFGPITFGCGKGDYEARLRQRAAELKSQPAAKSEDGENEDADDRRNEDDEYEDDEYEDDEYEDDESEDDESEDDESEDDNPFEGEDEK